MSGRISTVAFKRAPVDGDTLTINGIRILFLDRGSRSRPVRPKPHGFTFIVRCEALASWQCKTLADLINQHPERFGVAAKADQWRLRFWRYDVKKV